MIDIPLENTDMTQQKPWKSSLSSISFLFLTPAFLCSPEVGQQMTQRGGTLNFKNKIC